MKRISQRNWNCGKEIYINNKIKDKEIKFIKGIYNLYATVEGDNERELYKTHLRFNGESNQVLLAKCSSEKCSELIKLDNKFICKHNTAVLYSFIQNNKNEVDKVEDNKVSVLKIELKKMFKENEYNLITSYSEENKYSKEDEDVLTNLQRKWNSRKRVVVNGYRLKEVLELFHSRSIDFYYDYKNTKVKTILGMPSLRFTIKKNCNSIYLKAQRKLPIEIGNNTEVFLFEGKLYLSSREQSVIYRNIYNRFINYKEISYNIGKKEDIFRFVNKLSLISNNIVFDQDVIELLSQDIKVDFYLSKLKGSKVINIKSDRDYIFLKSYQYNEITEILYRYRFTKRDNYFVFLGDDTDFYDFKKNGSEKLKKYGKIFYSKNLNDYKFISLDDIKIDINSIDDTFYKLSIKVEEIGDVDYSIINEHYLNEERFYKFSNGSYLDFTDNRIKRLMEELNYFANRVHESDIVINRDKLLYLNYNYNFMIDHGESIFKEIMEVFEKEVLKLENFNGELRKYQVEGVKWLNGLAVNGYGGILADDMGLGKTIQVIAFLQNQINKRSIIIAPSSLVDNWMEELGIFAPKLKVLAIKGNKKERENSIKSLVEYQIIVTSYSSLRMDIELYKNEYFEYEFIDEGQYIKNSKSQISKLVRDIKTKCRYVLSGTPIENNLLELWNLIDFVNEGYLKDEKTFDLRYRNSDNNEELQRIIKPFILRREKEVVLDELPKKMEKNIYINLKEKESQYYRKLRKEIKEQYISGESNITVLALITKLRLMAIEPQLVEGFKENTIYSSKLLKAFEIISDGYNKGEKILVFSQFTKVLDRVKSGLKELEIEVLYLSGKTNISQRLELVNKFNNEKRPYVFLISLKAGGTGLNLTGATKVIHLDPWWNPAVENQATDRAYRIGQKNNVEVIKLISKGTIEENVVKMQNDKKELIESVLKGENFKLDLIEELLKI